RPAAHVAGLRITPHLEAGSATFEVSVAGAGDDAGDGAGPAGWRYRLAVTSDDGAFPQVSREVEGADGESGGGGATLEVVVPRARAWSPEDPHLYDCEVTLTPVVGAGEADAVGTYFGLRSVATGRWGGKPYEYVLLNGAPVYLRGALDQAFHPE